MWDAEIEAAAKKHYLDPKFVAAIIAVESEGNPFAWNPEPRYRYLWDVKKRQPFRTLTEAEMTSEIPPVDFPCLAGDRDQEWWGQQASWGLMQVMGAVAREHGFDGLFLPALVNPVLNVEFGCRVLSRLMVWARGDLMKIAAAYNAGRGGWQSEQGQAYTHKVMTAYLV